MLSFRYIPAILIAAALLPVGCRTYGGYGSESAILDQIQTAYETFSRDLELAQSDLRALKSVAQTGSGMQPLVLRMEGAVLAHEATLRHHESLLGQAREHADSYRFLNQTFGGMLSEQEVIYLRYRDLLRSLEATADTAAAGPPSGSQKRYHVVPPYFEQVRARSYARPAGEMSRMLMVRSNTGTR